MEAKLIKIDYQFFLYDVKDNLIATTEDSPYKRISMKNCQTIERGYDLDELADDFIRCPEDMRTLSEDREINSFKKGFQKALEILGDKKFSEEDVVNIAEYVRVASQSTPKVRTRDLFDEYQSLQQTEWDVEIEMVPALSNNGNVYYGDIPKLDADGCLILKRI